MKTLKIANGEIRIGYELADLPAEIQDKIISDFSDDTIENELCWEQIENDAKEIGLIIYELDDHRPNKGEFERSGIKTAIAIMANHGESCETYKDAKNYQGEYNKIIEKYSINGELMDNYEDHESYDNDFEDLENDFLSTLLEDYLIMLNKDIEYQYSREHITENIEANDYLFDEYGKILPVTTHTNKNQVIKTTFGKNQHLVEFI